MKEIINEVLDKHNLPMRKLIEKAIINYHNKVSDEVVAFWDKEKLWSKMASDDVKKHLDFWAKKQIKMFVDKEMELKNIRGVK